MKNLIPELQDWNNGRGIEPDDWISRVGNIEYALAYSLYFWPEFIEYNNGVFLERHFSIDGFQSFLDQDITKVEKAMNHLHIMDVFQIQNQEIGQEQIVYLGRKLKEIWATKLTKEFPDKKFTVVFNDYKTDGELVDYYITFSQI